MAKFALVDTHVHFWDPEQLHYPWLDGSELLNRPYLPADYTEAAGSLEIDKIVFVQAECLPGQAVTEAEWATSLAKSDRRIQGIVASAPLELGAGAEPTLRTLARNPLIKGIRRLLQAERDPEYCLRPDFVEGVRRLEAVGFSFDLGITRNQLPAATELARRCPDVRFMLDHIGVPNIREQQWDPWREHIRRLAELPNVYCKMSGVATAADHESWTKEDLLPAIDHVLSCFGFERTAFGSDWPVMLMATTLPRWVEALSWAVQSASDKERRALFRDTGIAFYRLS